MIVNTLIKILFFYFAFVVIRNLLKGASKINQVKEQMREHKKAYENQFRSTQGSSAGAKRTSSHEDIVEAEFRHL
tara:strand:+ start:1154 stop:1378 length:225 start_codon:yes stop_codon:yes gene_type:complete